jgi:tetrahydromethanopterin S-methyltransferase subunit G
MSVVEDVRQVIQDFLDPELRAISARLDAIEKIMEARFKEVDSRFKEVDSRFNEVSVRLQALQETVDRNDSSQKLMIANLTQNFRFEKRLADIEQELRRTRTSVA